MTPIILKQIEELPIEHKEILGKALKDLLGNMSGIYIEELCLVLSKAGIYQIRDSKSGNTLMRISVPLITDMINSPPHYTDSLAKCDKCGHSIECIEVTRYLPFNVGNIIKYLWRFDKKNGVEDLKKARWYLDDLIKELEK